MSADYGAIETILSLFLAGMFGVTGYFVGYCIVLRGHHLMLLGLIFASAFAWIWVVFLMDHPHLLAANKATLVADASLFPLCLGAVAGFFIHQGQPRDKQFDDGSV